MTTDEMRRGYYRILEGLFSPSAMYERSRSLLNRLEPHIFHGHNVRSADLRAAARSLWEQGVRGPSRKHYLRLLWDGLRRDVRVARDARHAATDVRRRLRALPPAGTVPLADAEVERATTLVDCAREAAVRAQPERGLSEISTWATTLRDRITTRSATAEDLHALYSSSREFFVRRRRLHRFPGAHLVKAFNLAIKGLHYQIVMDGIVHHARSDVPQATAAPPQLQS
jgi:hypothetical protein